MKSIDNYILERLNPRNLGPELIKEFPIDGSIEQIVNFLKSRGFKHADGIDKGDYYSFNNVCLKLNKLKSKVYLIDQSAGWIRFADTKNNKIDEDNPIYCIKSGSSRNTYAVERHGWWETYITDPKEFLKQITNKFDF